MEDWIVRLNRDPGFSPTAPRRRRFAAYWRLIYPGSALIRRSWLRAIRQRATGG